MTPLRIRRSWQLMLQLILLVGVTQTCWAGQVVTPDAREWAKDVIREEKSLETVAAPNTLAVLYFQNMTCDPTLDPLQKGLALMLITDLSTVKNLHVVERSKLQALVDELGMAKAGVVQPETAPRVGELLSAQYLVGGKFAGTHERLLLRSNLLKVPDAAVIGQPESGGKAVEVVQMEKELLFQIVEALKVELKPEEQARLRKPCSSNPQALLALFKGVDASDRKEYEKAASYYDTALADDPDVCVAREALTELKDLGLIWEGGRSAQLLEEMRQETSLTNQLPPKDEVRFTLTPRYLPTRTGTPILSSFP